MSLFRSGPPPHQTAVAMVGVKPGQTAVVIGAGDGSLAAAIALVTGLNGRTIVADDAPGSRETIDTAAAKAGALVEVLVGSRTSVQLDSEAADVVAVNRQLAATSHRTAVAREAVRLLRPGGRVVALEGETRHGLFGSLRRPSEPVLSGQAMCEALTSAGLRAVRVLAEAEGVTYVEGVKPRP